MKYYLGRLEFHVEKNVQKIVNATLAISGSFLGHQQKKYEKMILSEKAAFKSL